MGNATGQVEYAPAGGPVAAAPTPAPANGQGGPLTHEQMRAITLARQQGRRINRAATVAAISGWTLAVFAFITLLTGVFSLPSFLLGLGLGVVAFIELRGCRGLRQLDEAAPRLLGFNQLALAAMLVVYSAWGMWRGVAGPGPYDSYIAMGGDTAAMIEPIDRLNRSITAAFYALLICVSVVAQGCGSLYYFTRRRHLVKYLRTTPTWVVETLRAVAH